MDLKPNNFHQSLINEKTLILKKILNLKNCIQKKRKKHEREPNEHKNIIESNTTYILYHENSQHRDFRERKR